VETDQRLKQKSLLEHIVDSSSARETLRMLAEIFEEKADNLEMYASSEKPAVIAWRSWAHKIRELVKF
jgi:excinuclease UvrABC helicase subunit UvrB